MSVAGAAEGLSIAVTQYGSAAAGCPKEMYGFVADNLYVPVVRELAGGLAAGVTAALQPIFLVPGGLFTSVVFTGGGAVAGGSGRLDLRDPAQRGWKCDLSW